MTQLEMVKKIMRDNGLAEPPSLDTNGASDAAMAERLLEDEALLTLAEDCWGFNHKYDVTLEPDANDHLVVPDGTMVIDVHGSDEWRNVRQLGERLYDFDDNTDEFDADVKIRVTLRYKPSCFPFHIKQYAVARASRAFAAYRKDSARFGYLQQLERDARIRALQVEGDIADHNILNTQDSLRATGVIHHHQGWL